MMRAQAVAFLAIFTLLFSSLPAFASAPHQDDASPHMMLGQFVRAVAYEGDVFAYTLQLEGGGNYLLFSGDDEQASHFSFSVVGSDSGEIASGEQFGDTELVLEPDEYTLTFTATADAELSAVVVGDYGQLSDNQDKPGALFNGSYLQFENVEDTRYAKLSLPETNYFQLLHILVAGGDGDSYDIQVDNGDIYEFGSSSDEEETGIQFWTKGGEFDVEIEPTSGGDSLTVMVLLSGPAMLLEKDAPKTVSVGGDKPNYTFAVDVENPGSIVTAMITPDSDSVSYQVSASLNPATEIESAYVYGEASKLVFMAPFAGQYVFQLTNSNDPTKFTISVSEGDLAPGLPINGKVWGKVAAGEDAVYQLKIDDAGDFLSLVLVGNNEDLDLEAKLMNENGENVHSISLYGGESIAEMLSQSNAQAGLYEVRVKNQYGSLDGKYVISSRLEHPLEFAGQWAIDATASSEYQEERYNAMQATGEPNTPLPGDFPTAWASKDADGGEETLELTYEAAVVPMAVHIYESNAPGAITKIEAFNAEDEKWIPLWEGSEPSEETSRIFSPELESIDFATKQIRVTLDSAAVAGWNEIDAVELVGIPQ